jgi:hypothetical protein
MSKEYSSIRSFSQSIGRAAVCLVALFIFTAMAGAATYTVTNSNNDGAVRTIRSKTDSFQKTQESSTVRRAETLAPVTDFSNLVAATTTAVTSSADPSVFGQPVTFTATVSTAGLGTPTGNVQFFDGPNPLGGPVTLNASGQSQLTTSALSVGSHTITVQYAGNVPAGFNPSSGTLNTNPQTVNPASTTTVITSNQANPVGTGIFVTYTATVNRVAPSTTGTRTGTVTFFRNGTPICSNVAINAGGQATCTISFGGAGNYNITAQYSGDTNFTASPSPTFVQQVVGPSVGETITYVSSSANPSVIGQSVTFTSLTLYRSPDTGGFGSPVSGGVVQFYDGATPLGGLVLVNAVTGQAQVTTSTLSLGNHTITAQFLTNYGGGANGYNPSTGTLFNGQTVNAPQYSITGTIKYGITGPGQPDSFVSGVNLNATGNANASTISNGSGAYQLSNLLAGNYTVTPSKTGDVKGINSLDATRIQQYRVGLITLTPNQLIAADTDGNGIVNSLDASRIQQRAVGITAQNIIGQWKFVPGSKQYNSINSNLSAENYEAVLVGEVSGNWATATSFADDSEMEEEMLPKQDNLIDTADRLDNELAHQNDKRMEQSSDSQPNYSQSESAVAGGVQVAVSLLTNAKASTGTVITIPVSIGAIPAGSSIESVDFSVFYNSAVLQPTAVVGSNSGTLSSGCSVLPNSPLAGKVIVSGSCASAIITAAGGVLYNLQFTVIGAANQTTALSFVNPSNNTNTFQFNNGTPIAATNTGQFTVFAPTAASVTVSGRVTNDQGRGIRNVTIILTDSNGNQRTAQTTSFGYYDFSNIEAGETVTITAKARRFQFLQSTIVRTTNQSVTDADFVSEP